MNTKKLCLSALVFLLLPLMLIAQEENAPNKVERKMAAFMQMLRYLYVDDVDMVPIMEKGIEEMLTDLDPHSVYITSKEVKKANEPLQGNFDGIGVSFQIYKDTIVVVDVIRGGPSEKLGILSGDKIVKIDSLHATGDSATNSFVFKHLRGVKGTEVKVSIIRAGIGEPLIFNIIRDKIPIHSVETYFMANKNTGYIRLSRFSQNSMEEMMKALDTLIADGMENLILDLRGNTGGYMHVAVDLASEFLDKDKLVVYMEGKAAKRQDYISDGKGVFEKGKLVVLIDEGSASASEIVAGAVQDWDRGILVGRRSYGKGLVQRPLDLPDSSNVRLTIARYYTPSGRYIQKPYKDGLESYYEDIIKRYSHGEMVNPDSIKWPDTLRYFTANDRVVYGGGGIMPDIFVATDTQRASDFFIDLRRNNIFNNFVMNTIEKQKAQLLAKYPDFNSFDKKFETDAEFMDGFYRFAKENKVEHKNMREGTAIKFFNDMFAQMRKDSTLKSSTTYEEYIAKALWTEEDMKEYLQKKAKTEDDVQQKANAESDEYIAVQLKALLARNLYGVSYYYQIMKDRDEAYLKALQIITEGGMFEQLK